MNIGLRSGLLASTLLALAACIGVGDICSDYLTTSGCDASSRRMTPHHGIDFRNPAGGEVISATYGTVVDKPFNECAGPAIIVRTDIVARYGDTEDTVYVAYLHVEPLAELQISQRLKPGDVIGRTIPDRNTTCYNGPEHVHYELRVGRRPDQHINPHQFWMDGPGKVTCFNPDVPVPPGKAVAPVRCTARGTLPRT